MPPLIQSTTTTTFPHTNIATHTHTPHTHTHTHTHTHHTLHTHTYTHTQTRAHTQIKHAHTKHNICMTYTHYIMYNYYVACCSYMCILLCRMCIIIMQLQLIDNIIIISMIYTNILWLTICIYLREIIIQPCNVACIIYCTMYDIKTWTTL